MGSYDCWPTSLMWMNTYMELETEFLTTHPERVWAFLCLDCEKGYGNHVHKIPRI